ncbi:GNAT family N-acetyltransferase [Methylorubrum salsuginis]|uniref:Acetyltransferase (GNAT) family protein n=1 Tax=Methylorubrum salsuginis TaxID=414703 RepID=A0A1I4CW47_9HYPH|nr:GNAT family N-acetyltransferase [Methylorubrum salsuginis]SFK84236.1 Acetyltransferase (GNAT) family protein [Methylorubrum salsuginis]
MGRRYGLEIRSLTAADAPGLAEMLAAAGRPVTGTDLSGRLDRLRHSAGTALIALEWGPPSGIVVLHWYPALLDAAPVAQITTLLVAPDDRRRGIGRQLLKSAAQAARLAGCDSLQLLAGPERAELADFCRATGFVDGPGGFVRPLRKKG